MKHLSLLLTTTLLSLSSCYAEKKIDVENDSRVENQTMIESNISETGTMNSKVKSYNEIRFKDWEEKDWFDNGYISTLRTYLNDFNEGKIDIEMLDDYRKTAKSKFLVGRIEPFIMGGVFLQFVFLDMPNQIFTAWIYSYVNETNETVEDYEVSYISISEEVSGLTREDILKISNENPLFKL